jgi:hypothetical protein
MVRIYNDIRCTYSAIGCKMCPTKTKKLCTIYLALQDTAYEQIPKPLLEQLAHTTVHKPSSQPS